MGIRYYEDDAGPGIFAVRSREGSGSWDTSGGVFRLSKDEEGTPTWRFLPPNSPGRSLAQEPVPFDRYPTLAGYLQRAVSASLEVAVVLREDLYETRFGDGEFHDFHTAFLSENEARAYAEEHTDEDSDFYLRNMTLKAGDGVFEIATIEHEFADTYKAETVLEHLEGKLDDASST